MKAINRLAAKKVMDAVLAKLTADRENLEEILAEKLCEVDVEASGDEEIETWLKEDIADGIYGDLPDITAIDLGDSITIVPPNDSDK